MIRFSYKMKWGEVGLILARLLGCFLLLTANGLMLAVTWFTRNEVVPETSRAASAPGGAWRSVGQVALMTTGLLGLIALGFAVFTDDPLGTLARWRGEKVSIFPRKAILGDGLAGEYRAFNVLLPNNTFSDITIEGGTSNCGCVTTDDLPITIKPNTSEKISIRIKYTGGYGMFTHRFKLLTNAANCNVTGLFSGTVASSHQSASNP